MHDTLDCSTMLAALNIIVKPCAVVRGREEYVHDTLDCSTMWAALNILAKPCALVRGREEYVHDELQSWNWGLTCSRGHPTDVFIGTA